MTGHCDCRSLLGTVAIKIPMFETGAMSLGDLFSPIPGAGIEDEDLVAESQGLKDAVEVLFGIQGDQDRGNRDFFGIKHGLSIAQNSSDSSPPAESRFFPPVCGGEPGLLLAPET